MDTSNPIIFFDGICGFCNRFNQFVLKRDRAAIFRFAPLQSDVAYAMLRTRGVDTEVLDTIYVLVDRGTSRERLLSKAEAGFYVLSRLGRGWKLFSLLRFLPTRILNFVYDLIARHRYQILGRHDQCVLPDPCWQDRFIST